MSALDWYENEIVAADYPVLFDEDGDVARTETVTESARVARGERATYMVVALPKIDFESQVEFMEFGLGPWLTLAIDTTAPDPRAGIEKWLSPTLEDAVQRAEDHEVDLP